MKHLGDITKLSGYVVPAVDVVIGGSPCQGLSVAGKQAGLKDERSGLFIEQIRLVKEMRKADAARGKTNDAIRPRYMVWENVPGAFSSNKGRDFEAVLEETVRVAEPKAPPEKPVSWLPPLPRRKGLMYLRCPKCKNEFVQFLREPQTTNECRKCGAKIPLDALARFEFTCPDCKKVSYGRTNVEDAEIVNEKFSCVCGRSIPKLTWNPAKRCYTT